jgi:hypothetical protein
MLFPTLSYFKPLRAASGRPFPDDDHTGAAGKDLIVEASRQQEKPMTKIIACSELRYRTLAELESAHFRSSAGATAPGSRRARIVLARVDNAAPSRRASTGSRSSERGRFGPCRKARACCPRVPAFLRPQNVRQV